MRSDALFSLLGTDPGLELGVPQHRNGTFPQVHGCGLSPNPAPSTSSPSELGDKDSTAYVHSRGLFVQ